MREAPFPIKEIQLFLGNDLPGSSILPPVETITSPTLVSDDDTDPHVFPACAVTRSQSLNTDTSSATRQPSQIMPDNLINTTFSKEQLRLNMNTPLYLR